MNAIIEIDVPDYQIGQEVSIYFKDTMMIKGVVQEPKTGHWTERKMHEMTGFFLPTCSECGQIQPYTHHTFRWNYCPTCGAKMESEDKNGTNNYSTKY